VKPGHSQEFPWRKPRTGWNSHNVNYLCG
jgi:hypothetical protein